MDDNEAKNRSLAGNIGIAFFVIALVTVVVAFSTPSWLVSDYRITGARLNRLGLWVDCFRSLPDPHDPNGRRFFVGCRWIYDPFTTGYDRIRGYLMPKFMIATQFFFTICLLGVIFSGIMTLLYFLCCTPDQRHFIKLIYANAIILLVGGVSGCIAVIVFAACANTREWMPGHDNNFFGWSFALACIGVAACLIASILFFTDGYIQRRKKRQLKDSQARFELEHEARSY